MTDRHLLITGASRGIGAATALRLAGDFGRMTLVGRNRERHAEVIAALEGLGVAVTLVECDLASLVSVSQAVQSIREPIDVVLANAGVGGRRGQSEDGFEIHFGVNHLAHHLLVTDLADHIRDRVVVVSSNAHYDSTGLDLDAVRRRTASLTGFPEYKDSKLANVLFGRELARRFPFAVHVVHPGMVATDIWRRIPWPVRPLFTRRMATPDEGADTPAWACVADGLENGGYYARRALREPSRVARDREVAAKLWDRSEEWVAPYRKGQ
ncbi:MAG: SDR family NAD(P)-dependent oxidoreductase [Acidimicrobiia bacterium]